MPAGEALPRPGHRPAVPPQMVGIADADFLAIPRRRIEKKLPAERRNPLRRAGHHLFHGFDACAGQAHRVPHALLGFQLMNRIHHPPVPILAASFVDDFVEHVVEIIHGVDNLLQVRRLQLADLRITEIRLSIAVPVTIGCIDIVLRVVRMSRPRLFPTVIRTVVAESLEELNGAVNATFAALGDARPHAIEVHRIEFLEIEFQAAVERHARAGANVQRRLIYNLVRRPWRPRRLLPSPQAHEVVVVALHHGDVTRPVKRRDWRDSIVLQIRPGMRASQENGTAAAVSEVAGIFGMDF